MTYYFFSEVIYEVLYEVIYGMARVNGSIPFCHLKPILTSE
ncbi:hypothetical protein J2Y02_003416 [Neobacillus drentensis]|nr:hypothetical protein [Neobacillus drentensis]